MRLGVSQFGFDHLGFDAVNRVAASDYFVTRRCGLLRKILPITANLCGFLIILEQFLTMDQLLTPSRGILVHLDDEEKLIYDIVLKEMNEWKMIHPSIIGMICGRYLFCECTQFKCNR